MPITFLFSFKEKHWECDLIKFCDYFYKKLPKKLLKKQEYQKDSIEIKKKFRLIKLAKNK